jgi:phosphopantothenate---cysteine ligase (ATP)
MVPLERNTVRFIDNFSTGQRGAASTEYFLERNYLVIFFHRSSSALPYQRQMKSIFESNLSTNTALIDIYQQYRASLLLLSFQSVVDYLTGLEQLCCLLRPYGRSVLIYACAAVSDYYIPDDELVEHKIQSNQSDLVIRLRPVPKCLGSIKDVYARDAFVVSFKLETDEHLLEDKCVKSAEKYHQDVVIGNLLQTRTQQVRILTSMNKQWTTIDRLDCHDQRNEIEYQIVEFLVEQHRQYLFQQ